MDSLLNNPLLQPAVVNKLIESVPMDESEYMLTNMIPFETVEAEKVVVDVEHMLGGMTQAAVRGAESPTIDQSGVSQFEFRPAHWREKYRLTENDIAVLRKLGTASQLERAQERIAKIVKALRYRLENRMEWSKWQMILGSLTIAQSDVQFSVDYHVPTEFQPVPANLWDTASGDPLSDLLDWIQLFRDEASEPEQMVYNTNIEKVMLQNSAIRTLRDSLFTGQSNPGMLTRENVKMVLNAYCALPVTVYDKGYWIIQKLMVAATPAATTLTLEDATGIEADDVLVIEHENSGFAGRRNCTVQSVTGNVVTLTAAVGGTVTFPVGSMVRTRKPFIPDDRFIIMGKLPPGSMGGDRWAEFISTFHYYGPGGLLNPTPGTFIRVDNHEKDDPPTVDVIAGVSGLPVAYTQTNNLVAAVI
jgi:hypothetical protein